MKRKRFSEEQIIGVLKEAEAGAKTADLARRHGVSEATIYNWKSKYGGLEVSEARRLKELESENAKLKRLLADAMLFWRGARRWAWSGITLPPADRWRTATSRASMAGCATSCSTRHCSRASRMPGSRSLRGWRITTGRDRTHPWATQHRRRSPPIWISNGLLRYALRAPL